MSHYENLKVILSRLVQAPSDPAHRAAFLEHMAFEIKKHIRATVPGIESGDLDTVYQYIGKSIWPDPATQAVAYRDLFFLYECLSLNLYLGFRHYMVEINPGLDPDDLSISKFDKGKVGQFLGRCIDDADPFVLAFFPEEHRVLALAKQGHSEQRIARILGLARNQVSALLNQAYEHLAACVAIFLRQELASSFTLCYRERAHLTRLLLHIEQLLQKLPLPSPSTSGAPSGSPSGGPSRVP